MDNSQDLVRRAFQKHGVDNLELEKAISDILNQALDSRSLSKRIWKDVIEHYERDKRIKDNFR
ncbi:hypothetical protein [Salipaludibacillus sp. CF4.18]|uniref:hypothetical protein n=1 Tax=Salipaludibacillus sp. CF4.18 TaxID=3373081 RepID=UPI003EE68BD9